MNNLNDTALIEKVLGDDTGAFGVLVGRYSEQIYGLVLRICGNREDAEEVTQDAFVKAYSHLGKFRKESSFSSWLYRIAYNTAISHIRRNRNVRLSELYGDRMPEADGEPLPDETGSRALSREEQLERLEEALRKLPPDDRAILQLFYLEDKPVREIAEIVSQSEGNVKTRLHRIRKRLGTIYEKL